MGEGRTVVLGVGALASAIAGELGVPLVASAPGGGTPVPTLVVVALAGATLGEIVDHHRALAAASIPSLAVLLEGDAAVVGPVTVPGRTACLECRLRQALDGPVGAELPAGVRALRAGRADDWAEADLGAVARLVAWRLAAAGLVARRLAAAGSPSGADRPFTTTAVWRRGDTALLPTMPRGGCTTCSGAGDPLPGALLGAALAELARCLEVEGYGDEQLVRRGSDDRAEPYRSVGIVGGGTAGYLTALALRARHPQLEVTLIESSAIPVISVGEATTREMVQFLHGHDGLALDAVELHRRVRPTLKLGIQFLWGAPGDGCFHYPFSYAPLADPVAHDGTIDTQSVASLLMAADRAPVLDGGDGTVHSLLDTVRFAYHLDNPRFVAHLADQAARRGVVHVDATVAEVRVTPDGREVDHLVTEDGRVLRYDLYVDASGFRSLLLEGALGSRFVDYSPTLFTDRAIAADVPHDGCVKPYTRATTFEAGWCWTIPFEDADHIGSVYSSAFLDEEAALAEMRRAHPAMGEPRHIRFRSGRHEHFFSGNVVAVGNAYAFVEPLESTALHMVVREVELLTTHLPGRADDATKARLNRILNEDWDELRWFLGLHYRFNRRLDSPFWRAVQAEADISGAEERLAVYAERAPLSDRPSLFHTRVPRDFFGHDQAIDTVLLGQQVASRPAAPHHAPDDWRRRVELRRHIVDRALPQQTALPLLRDQRPDLLQAWAEDPTGWVQNRA